MSDIRSLTLLRLEASGPFLAPVNVIFQKIHDLAVTPSSAIPIDLKNEVLRLSSLELKDLTEKTKKGCTLLFTACKSGNASIVSFLLTHCQSVINIERKCVFEEEGDPVLHYVPPLWCAVVSGHLNVTEVLLQHSADINGCSNNGSTPLRSACFQGKMAIVQYLVEHGASINRPNHDGGTCLINAVKSVELCRYLIESKADLNARDVEGRNVLYYAIDNICLDTVKLLLDRGVDGRVKLGDQEETALQLACLKGDQSMVECILGMTMTHNYSPEDEANAWELLGATQIVKAELRSMAFNNWRRSVDCRQFNRTPKTKLVQRECYADGREFMTHADLDWIQEGDLEQLLLQSALITDRILGLTHEETRFRIMRVGAKFADSMQFSRYISLWRFCLQIRIEQQSLFNFKTCFTAEGLVRVLLDLYLNHHQQEEMRLAFDDVYSIFLLLSDELEDSRKLLQIRPVFKKQQQNFDRIFKCVTHLIYLMLKTVADAKEREVLKEAVTKLILKNITSAGTNDTLLHLSVSRLNYIKHDIVIFPSHDVVALLLDCEARVNAQNDSKSTPLHVATTPYNFNNPIIHLLLENGAHVDLPNKLNDNPAQYISMNPASDVPLANYASLKCCAATTIVRYKIPYRGELPATLEQFVRIHEA